MKLDRRLSAALIGVVAIAIVQPLIVRALQPAQINAIKKTTIRIDQNNEPIGSGVIINHVGNTYYVLTANHVVNQESEYAVVTDDGRRYGITSSQIIQLPDIDLAILSFNSSTIYPKVELGTSETLNTNEIVYVSGYLGQESERAKGQYRFQEGRINSLPPTENNPYLAYSNQTQRGMSGGGVFNQNSKLIGIHLSGDGEVTRTTAIVAPGFSQGIHIRKFIELAPKAFNDRGKQKLAQQDYRGAIADFSLGLEFNKQSADAYLGRGHARFAAKDYNGAIADATSAINLNRQLAQAYLLRGVSRAQQNKHKEAIEDFNQAIQINSNLADAYGWRAVSRAQMRDIPGANQDVTENIRRVPDSPYGYRRRSQIRKLAYDNDGAAQDIQAAEERDRTYRENDVYQMALNQNFRPQSSNFGSTLPQPKPTPSIPPQNPPIPRPEPVSNPQPIPAQTATRPTIPDQRTTIVLPSNWSLINTLNAASRVLAIAINPKQPMFASGTQNGNIQLWNLNTGERVYVLPAHRGVVRAITFSEDGRRLASGGLDGAKIWDVQRRNLIRPINVPIGLSIDSIAFSRSGQTLAAGMADGTIKIWQADSGREWKENFPRHSLAVTALVYSPDGTTIASGSKDKTIKVWRLQRPEVGRVLHNFTEHQDLISSLAFSPDGQILVSSSIDRTIKIWDLRSGGLLQSISVGTGVEVYEVAISPDGRILASGNNREIKLWNLPDGKPLGTLSGHTGLVRSLAFSPDSRLISGSDDSTIKIWQKR